MTNSSDRLCSEYTEYTGSFLLSPRPGHALLALICSGSGSFYHQGKISEFEAGHCFLLYSQESAASEEPSAAHKSPESKPLYASNKSSSPDASSALNKSSSPDVFSALNKSSSLDVFSALNKSPLSEKLHGRIGDSAAAVSPETSCQISLFSFSLADISPQTGSDFSDNAVRRLFSGETSFYHLKLLPEQMDSLLSYQKLCLSMQKDSLTASRMIYRQTLHAMLLYFARTLAVLKPEKRQDSREFASRRILMEQVKCLVRQNYSESLSLSDIAASVFTNPSYLSRVFKEETGIPLSHYINQIRIQNAKKLLEDTEELIIDIAVACGYNYIPHFNRVFKEHTGMTPSAYRKSCRLY